MNRKLVIEDMVTSLRLGVTLPHRLPISVRSPTGRMSRDSSVGASRYAGWDPGAEEIVRRKKRT